MKIAIDKNILSNALDIVLKSISSKSHMPILECVHIQASINKIILTGNNFETAIQHIVGCEVLEVGEILTNARLLSEIIKKMPDEELDIISTQKDITISAGKTIMKINMVEGTFPPPPEIEEDGSLTLDQQVLKDMVSRISFAASIDTNRAILQGMLLQIKDGKFQAVACDGYVLAIRTADTNLSDNKIIIHAKQMDTVVKLLSCGEVQIIMSKNTAVFNTGNTKIFTKILDGEYVAYSSFLPQEFTMIAEINVQELQNAIDRSLLIAESDKKIPLVMKFDDDVLSVTMENICGEIRDDIAVNMSGEGFTIAYDPRKLSDCLRKIEDKKIMMKFTSNLGPCLLAPIEGDNFTYMVLPVRYQK